MAHVTVHPDSPSQPIRFLADTTLGEALRSLPQSGRTTPLRPDTPASSSAGGTTGGGGGSGTHSASRTVLISHPPPPEALTAELQLRIVPGDTSPLDPMSLATLPLSTPPVLPVSLERARLWSVLPPDAGEEPPSQPFDMKSLAALVPPREELVAPTPSRGLSEAGRRKRDQWPLILVTGGCGYIGSHVVLDILRQGEYGVVVADDFSNSGREAIRRVRLLSAEHWDDKAGELMGKGKLRAEPTKRRRDMEPPLYLHETDIRDYDAMDSIFARYRVNGTAASRIHHVIHFAALKSVPISQQIPIDYYSTNVAGTISLIKLMQKHGVPSLVFSSSAVVYGKQCEGVGILEEASQPRGTAATFGQGVTNPYGRSKLMCEAIIADACDAALRQHQASGQPGLPPFRAVLLRYTNPSGNDPSGLIGDCPAEAQNLMPVVSQVLQGRRECVYIYGWDYDTRDGTGASAHVSDPSFCSC